MKSPAEVAVESVERASEILLEMFGKVEVEPKRERDFVTEADRKSERAIVEVIKAHFPEHLIITEEAGSTGKESEWTWHVDPLDGTHNFAHGLPEFGVSVAVEYRRELVAGAVKLPLLGKTYVAEKGGGAYCNGERIKVSERPIQESLVGTGVPSFKTDLFRKYLDFLDATYEVVLDVRKTGSAVLDLVFVAEGIFDACWEMSVKSWDVAAGALIVKEAGGKVSDFEGKEDYLRNGNVLAGNSLVHAFLLESCLK